MSDSVSNNVNYLLRVYILSLGLKPNEKKKIKSGCNYIVCKRVTDTDVYVIHNKTSEITICIQNEGVIVKKYNKNEHLSYCTQKAIQSYLYAMFLKTKYLRRKRNE